MSPALSYTSMAAWRKSRLCKGGEAFGLGNDQIGKDDD
jgi:hypothetical protein